MWVARAERLPPVATRALWSSFGEFNVHANEIEDPVIAGLRLQLAVGQSEQTLAHVELALRSAEAAGRRRRALRIQYLHAQMLQAAGRRSEAAAAFNSAILNAAAHGMARVLADDAWTMKSLVSRAEVAAEPRAVALLRELTARAASSDLHGSRETSRDGGGRRASLDKPRDANPAPGMERPFQQGDRA